MEAKAYAGAPVPFRFGEPLNVGGHAHVSASASFNYNQRNVSSTGSASATVTTYGVLEVRVDGGIVNPAHYRFRAIDQLDKPKGVLE